MKSAMIVDAARIIDDAEDRLPLSFALAWDRHGLDAWHGCSGPVEMCQLLHCLGKWPAMVAGLACARFALELVPVEETRPRRGLEALASVLRGEIYNDDFDLATDQLIATAEEFDLRRHNGLDAKCDAVNACCNAILGAAPGAAKNTLSAHSAALGLVHWSLDSAYFRRLRADMADAIRAAVPFPTTAMLVNAVRP